MTEQYKKWANLDIKDIEPMEVTEIEVARMKKKVINKQSIKVQKHKWRNVVAASLLLLGVIVTANTTSIATSIKGYFEDVTNGNGTVVGTQYTAGVDDFSMESGTVIESENHLLVPLTVTLHNITVEPFASMESLGVREVLLVDDSNNEVGKFEVQEEEGLRSKMSFELEEKEKLLSEIPAISDSSRIFKVNLLIDDKSLFKEQQYKLKIQSLYIYKPADAPLQINGNWEIDIPIN